MTHFDGMPVKRVSQKTVVSLLNSLPKDGKMTAQHSKVPEFFDDSAYFYDGKLQFVIRHKHQEFYVTA